MPEEPNKTERARSLRAMETKTEKLMWGVLRSRQVCGLKFRRQHPIGPFFADFACVSRKLVIEIDGGYHDVVVESDVSREEYLKQNGWDVIRFGDDDVEGDPEVVAMAIANHLGVKYEFRKRDGNESGMKNVNSPIKRLRRIPSRWEGREERAGRAS